MTSSIKPNNYSSSPTNPSDDEGDELSAPIDQAFDQFNRTFLSGMAETRAQAKEEAQHEWQEINKLRQAHAAAMKPQPRCSAKAMIISALFFAAMAYCFSKHYA